MQDWHRAVERISAYIEAHIGDHPSLTDMAREVGYSPTHCSTVFRRVSGMTVRGYVAARRLSLAAKRLRDTDEPLTDIALAYGFSSQQALTRAFQSAYGVPPGRYRKRPTPIPLRVQLHAPSATDEGGEITMNHPIDVRCEYIPAHRYLGAFKRSETKNGPIWPWHDCDLLCGIIESLTDTDPIVARYTAGWDNAKGQRSYFFGSGIDKDAKDVVIPEGMELRDVPGSYYLVFACPPFKYPEENGTVMGQVEALAWSYDPTPLGFEWNEGACPCYQRHYPEVLGYQVLRPVKKMAKA